MISHEEIAMAGYALPDVPVTIMPPDVYGVINDMAAGRDGYYLNQAVPKENFQAYRPITQATFRLVRDPYTDRDNEYAGNFFYATVRLVNEGDPTDCVSRLQDIVESVMRIPANQGKMPHLISNGGWTPLNYRTPYTFRLNSETVRGGRLYAGVYIPRDSSSYPYLEVSNGIYRDPDGEEYEVKETFSRWPESEPMFLPRDRLLEHLGEAMLLMGDVLGAARKDARLPKLDHAFMLQPLAKMRMARMLGATGARTAFALPPELRQQAFERGLSGKDLLKLSERVTQQHPDENVIDN